MTLPLFPGVQGGQGNRVRNASTAAQVVAAATLTYITGSSLAVPPGGLKVGSKLRFKFNMTKTAAGTATSTISVVVGTAGTTADTARLSFTKPAGTAAADEGQVTIDVIVRSVSSTGVITGELVMVHGLENTGHAVIPVVCLNAVSAAFDNSGDELIVGLVITTGASDAITIQMVDAELLQ